MDKLKIKRLLLVLTIVFASCTLITACNIMNKPTEPQWDLKTRTYTDDKVKMTYIKIWAQDIKYDHYDNNQKSSIQTINVDGKDQIAIRVFWKLQNNSQKTISFKDLYKHAINGIPAASSVTQGGKKEDLLRIKTDSWPTEDGYYGEDDDHKDLKPGESVKVVDTYALKDTTTPIVIYFNKDWESIGSYKISWTGKAPYIYLNELTMDAITNANKMAETNKKEDAAQKDKLTKTLEGITVDENDKLTWTKADYDALVADYGGNGTKLTDVLAKYPHPRFKDKSDTDITLSYGDAGSDNAKHFISLSFQQVSGSASDFTLVSKSEKGLK
ncbi:MULTISPECIES: DUF5067 domain-containing protein [Clostridium]|uniref:DUF5067 domain-containing protein n=1 Tax=Clostridium TaxID=1485 RepID=UPI000825469B|nr:MULTISPECIES: DUF5067 domain-containing protein [Clostridium]PJI08406.1 DUF5067 domain-containing protein [Clostridium sp. CT7]